MVMTINGSGSITGLSAGGLPDATVTQADLAPNVAATGPCFSAYPSAVTAIAAAAYTKLNYQVEEFDLGGWYDVANSRFTPNVAGYYLITGSLSLTSSTTTAAISIYKNGVMAKTGQILASASTSSVVSALVYLNGMGDYVELFGYSTAAQNNTTTPSYNYFQGFLARAA